MHPRDTFRSKNHPDTNRVSRGGITPEALAADPALAHWQQRDPLSGPPRLRQQKWPHSGWVPLRVRLLESTLGYRAQGRVCKLQVWGLLPQRHVLKAGVAQHGFKAASLGASAPSPQAQASWRQLAASPTWFQAPSGKRGYPRRPGSRWSRGATRPREGPRGSPASLHLSLAAARSGSAALAGERGGRRGIMLAFSCSGRSRRLVSQVTAQACSSRGVSAPGSKHDWARAPGPSPVASLERAVFARRNQGLVSLCFLRE